MRIGSFTSIAVLFVAVLSATGARAQSESDRLREALRQAIAQSRALEDQRASLQARLAEADRKNANLQAQVDAAKNDVREAQKQLREAVDEFNQRLADRDQTLEKWKSAYEEAANVARSKDAERAKFEGESNSYKAVSKACLAKNTQLMKVGRELLHRYEGVYFGDLLAVREPLIGARRVQIQNLLQDYNDKILDQKASSDPAEVQSQAAPPSQAAPQGQTSQGQGAAQDQKAGQDQKPTNPNATQGQKASRDRKTIQQ